jgi:immunity protein, SdpI family
MRAPRSQSLVIFTGYVAGAVALYRGLPEQVPPAWTVPGRGALWLGAPMVAFLLPTAAAVTDVLLRGLAVRSPIGEPSSTNVLATYDAVMLRFTVFVVGVHVMVLAGLQGTLRGHEWAARIVPLMLGLTLISVGNLLPRTRPNLAIGIRTRRTLSDRALWIRVHRSAGYLIVACGAVIVLSAIALPGPAGPGMILVVGPVALAGTGLLVRSSGKTGAC